MVNVVKVLVFSFSLMILLCGAHVTASTAHAGVGPDETWPAKYSIAWWLGWDNGVVLGGICKAFNPDPQDCLVCVRKDCDDWVTSVYGPEVADPRAGVSERAVCDNGCQLGGMLSCDLLPPEMVPVRPPVPVLVPGPIEAPLVVQPPAVAPSGIPDWLYDFLTGFSIGILLGGSVIVTYALICMYQPQIGAALTLLLGGAAAAVLLYICVSNAADALSNANWAALAPPLPNTANIAALGPQNLPAPPNQIFIPPAVVDAANAPVQLINNALGTNLPGSGDALVAGANGYNQYVAPVVADPIGAAQSAYTQVSQGASNVVDGIGDFFNRNRPW